MSTTTQNPIISTIVTGAKAAHEFRILLKSIQLFEPSAKILVLTDPETVHSLGEIIKTSNRGTPPSSKSKIHLEIGLEKYQGLSRADMEARSGITYDSMFKDYTIEKATAVEAAFRVWGSEPNMGVWFLDSDITLLAALPTLPNVTRIALSPHFIRAADEKRYGHYNAGMMWFKDTSLLDVWRGATHGSRFYEQAALEDVAASVKSDTELYELPMADNFGWWRYLQSADTPDAIQRRLRTNRTNGKRTAGLMYDGAILRSVHTHLYENTAFNNIILHALQILDNVGGHRPAQQLRACIQRTVKDIAGLDHQKA